MYDRRLDTGGSTNSSILCGNAWVAERFSIVPLSSIFILSFLPPAGHSFAELHVFSASQGSVFSGAKAVLVALGLGHGVSGYPTSPPSLRRKRRTPTTSPQPLPAASATTRHHPNGCAYLLKKPWAGTFPPSPFGLIEELLTDDPWKLLIGCIMLNQTTRSQVRHVFRRQH